MGSNSPRHNRGRWWQRRPPRRLERAFGRVELARRTGGGVKIIIAEEKKVGK